MEHEPGNDAIHRDDSRRATKSWRGVEPSVTNPPDILPADNAVVVAAAVARIWRPHNKRGTPWFVTGTDIKVSVLDRIDSLGDLPPHSQIVVRLTLALK